jgi:outer membrane protein assembly factor BamA
MKMNTKQNLFLLGVSIALLTANAPAQKSVSSKAPVASERKLVAVKVTGTDRYTDKEIVPAAGLQLGDNVDVADFKEAARRLGDTGMFIEVSYSFSYSAAGTKLELQLKDADDKKLVPAHFENFVWFKDTELISELQRRVSLFKQKMPVDGTLLDRTVEALQAMVDERKIPGRVSYLRESQQEGGALTGIAFQVDDVDIRIRDVEFPGAAPDHVPLLRQASRKLLGAQYTRSPLAIVARVDYLPVYLQRGYLEASFAPSEAKVSPQPPTESQIDVEAIFAVTPGKVYSTSEVAWKGNAALSTDQLQALIHLPAGQPANAVRLTEDLEKVAKLYRTRGYMNVQIRPAALMDEEKSTVHYDLNVVEGDQYKMGELELQGLDSQSTARLREAWTLREGEPYNADYPNTFVDGCTKLLPAGVHWGISVHESVNASDKSVDVTIHFTPR